MARLFISYRRSDTGPYAGRLAARLARFQFESVFHDREDIPLGDNFADVVRHDLATSSAVLVLIGSRWLTACDDAGARRLDDSADWVRREISLALGRRLRVIPVLFDGALMPAATELPSEIAGFATSQAYDLTGAYFDRDADYLARRLEQDLIAESDRPADRRPEPTPLLIQLLTICVVLTLVTVGTAVAPSVVPALPSTFWVFPGSMSLASFLWLLYWFGEGRRAVKARAVA